MRNFNRAILRLYITINILIREQQTVRPPPYIRVLYICARVHVYVHVHRYSYHSYILFDVDRDAFVNL